MTLTPRRVLVGLGILFAAYSVFRSMWWTAPVEMPIVFIAATVLTFIVTVVCIFAAGAATSGQAPLTGGRGGPTVLPMWGCALALLTVAIVPTAIAVSLPPAERAVSQGTIYLGALGVLLTIVIVRRRPIIAWVGVGILTVGSAAWLGPVAAFSQGLTGSLMWVLVAQLLLRSLDRLTRDALRLVDLQHTAIAWRTWHDVRRRERRERVQFALLVAGPIMERVIEVDGALTEDERTRARVAEGALRDELRGGRLLDARVRAELNAARGRGVNVTVFDEGTLDTADAADLARIRSALARTIAGADADRLIVRTSNSPDVAVTIVGRDASASADDVALWEEIPRHPRTEPEAS